MPRRKSIERDTIVEYWHIDEHYHTDRQKRLIELLAREDAFNDISSVVAIVDEEKLVLAQLYDQTPKISRRKMSHVRLRF